MIGHEMNNQVIAFSKSIQSERREDTVLSAHASSIVC
jgi:hypothetical protein